MKWVNQFSFIYFGIKKSTSTYWYITLYLVLPKFHQIQVWEEHFHVIQPIGAKRVSPFSRPSALSVTAPPPPPLPHSLGSELRALLAQHTKCFISYLIRCNANLGNVLKCPLCNKEHPYCKMKI